MFDWLTGFFSKRSDKDQNAPLYLYVHLPKCAGTSMLSMLSHVGHGSSITIAETESKSAAMEFVQASLSRSKRPENIRLVMGRNVLYRMHEIFDRPPFYFTILRDPIKRYVSQYNFYVDAAQNKNHIAHCAGRDRVVDGTRIISLKEFAQRGMDKNMMTRALADALNEPGGTDHWWWVDESTQLERAKEMVFKMSFIGFVERLHEDCAIIFRHLNIAPPIKRINTSSHKVEIDQSVVELIRQNNIDDMMLYDFSKNVDVKEVT